MFGCAMLQGCPYQCGGGGALHCAPLTLSHHYYFHHYDYYYH